MKACFLERMFKKQKLRFEKTDHLILIDVNILDMSKAKSAILVFVISEIFIFNSRDEIWSSS